MSFSHPRITTLLHSWGTVLVTYGLNLKCLPQILHVWTTGSQLVVLFGNCVELFRRQSLAEGDWSLGTGFEGFLSQPHFLSTSLPVDLTSFCSMIMDALWPASPLLQIACLLCLRLCCPCCEEVYLSGTISQKSAFLLSVFCHSNMKLTKTNVCCSNCVSSLTPRASVPNIQT